MTRFLLTTLMLAGLACQLPSSTPDTAPLDADYNKLVAAKAQDSMATIVSPASFHSVITGDPFNHMVDNAMFKSGLEGHATIEMATDGDTQPVIVRIHLAGGNGRSITIDWETPPRGTESTVRAFVASAPFEIEQTIDGSFPTVHATFAESRRSFESKSGTLKITMANDKFVKGTFFFELQPEGVSSEWFELAGAFDAEISG